ncbi:dihydrodipicolinate synthase family protein [Mesorhizobium sp. Cs1299R1N1]|uniref:dihydrodipicolinate synthase family protein n=1 Tax=Mesorhizobium sp. Cs1299R1N1 TaxID=3015172 RepID=UPI00301BB00F
MKFEGIYPPIVTPFTKDGQIDRSTFATIIEFLLDAKVHGIIVGGTTGEYFTQTPQERIDLATFTKQVIGSRCPLIVSTGATRTEDAVHYAKAARELGADAIMITSPPYALPTQSENARHALAIDKAADLPIMLYNYPARAGVAMGHEYFREVSRSENVIAIKEASGDMSAIHNLASNFPNIELSCGWDDQAIEFFAWGAKSWVCAGANFLPHEHVALYEACVIQRDFDKGRAIMKALLPMLAIFDAGKLIQSVKYGCKLAGVEAGTVRAPLGPLTSEEEKHLQRVYMTLKGAFAHIMSRASNE